MKTILSHFYNEEYLLPFWLNHHKRFFDHGIMINYASTDKSVEIIKSICPTWDIVNSKNECFDANAVDREVEDYEQNIEGWRVCLNTTEFLIGEYESLNHYDSKSQILAQVYAMVDSKEIPFNSEIMNDLILERTWGFANDNKGGCNYCRSLHNFPIKYPIGRHFRHVSGNEKFAILKYMFSPWNENMIKRKLQIQHRIPQSDRDKGFGHQHIRDRDSIQNDFISYQNLSENLINMINKLYKPN
jgi:hypothetical protein